VIKSQIHKQLQLYAKTAGFFTWTALVILSLLGCKQFTNESSQSDIQGIGGILDDAIPVIEKKTPSVLNRFADSIRNSVIRLRTDVPSISTRPNAVQLRQMTSKVYVTSLVDVGGIPRSQGAPMLKELVSDQRGACGGVSCARVLGVGPDEVDGLLDETYAAVLANEKLAREKPSIWKILAGSLKPITDSVSRLTTTFPKALEVIAKESPRPWPTNSVAPQPILSQKDLMARLTHEEQQSLTMYTYAGFDQVRLYENSTSAELKSAGWSSYDIKSASLFSQQMDRALRKLPVASGSLYRGIHGIKPKDVATFVWHWQEKIPLGLGPKNKPAVTSTSWDPQIAKNFVFHKWKPNYDDSYGILFEIRPGHMGVGIEQIAVHTFQREVLLPKDSKFMIEKVAPIEGESKILSITLRPIQ
jgi:hypothetical protein